ncbi:MAG: nucleoside deaminase [Dongiaceae bacterium]
MVEPPEPKQRLYETGMRHALDAARRATAEGELPYGAVVMAADGTLIATAHDRVATSGDLAGCILVSTVEPCAMCSGAAWNAGIATAVFGLSMRELKALRPDALEEPLGPVADLYAGLARRIEGVPGVLGADGLALWTER